MAGEAVTAMIVADDGGDDPLADRREDLEAAAERERKAKVAKLKAQTANAMEVVRGSIRSIRRMTRGAASCCTPRQPTRAPSADPSTSTPCTRPRGISAAGT
mmetsp:Transcript_14829/g.48113  ORF Transcript_14829/g.48113 Transcript_14829/m.48113 type:complete len:102 (+) Transcript_14829:215-520(+)